MANDLPAHASPALQPAHSAVRPSYFPLDHDAGKAATDSDSHDDRPAPPPTILSPSITPPATPGTGTPANERDAASYAPDAPAGPAPKLLNRLPNVSCVVRARIPTTTGVEMFLHLYQNDIDNKEHLAIVFGDKIRSRSLDEVKPGETEMDRMIRGAYVGRLHPGRTSSRIDVTTGKASPLLRSLSTKKMPPDFSIGGAAARSAVPAEIPHTTSQAILDASLPNGTSKLATTTSISQSPLVRIHSECYTGETVWSARCDCGEQLDEAARLMSLPSASSSGGVIIYLRQEGRGIGLSEKLKAYNLQDLGSDTVEANLLLRHPADARSYGLATAMLCDLDLGGDVGIRLLTNNPDKIRAVEGPAREVVVKQRVAMVPLSWKTGGEKGFNSPEVGQYLRTKIERMGHLLNMNG